MPWLQVITVIALLAGSIVFAFWRLSPAGLRLRILDALAPASRSSRWLTQLRGATLQELGQGCGTCSGRAADKSRR